MSGFRVVVKLKYFYNPIPNHLAIEFLFYRHALDVGRVDPVQLMDYILQLFQIGHFTASSKSPTLQNVLSTPAAMAGVQRSVL